MPSTESLESLPASLLAAVRAYMQVTGRDYTDARTMRSMCETESRALAYYLDAVEIDGDRPASASWVEAAPRDGDALARGHVVCCVTWDGETWAVDLTAAQFGEGPCCWFV